MRLDAEGILGLAMLGAGGGRSALELFLIALAYLASRLPRDWAARVRDALGGIAGGRSVRVVSHRRFRNRWGELVRDDGDANNLLLQAAIMRGVDSAGALWPVAHAAFVGKHRAASAGAHVDDGRPPGATAGSCYFDGFRVVRLPPYDEWVRAGGGVEFRRTKTTGSGDDKEEVETFYLRGAGPDVDAFVAGCVRAYSDILRSKDDSRRFVYVPFRRRDGIAYKRHPLCGGRTFDTLGLPDKARVLRLLDSFAAGTGKFRVPGHPRKLGFLLHGPPGTGKTTFVKALAARTRRHVVSVALDAVRTNQELLSVFYDGRFAVDDDEGGVHALGVDEVVFVLEDVDAAGKAVGKRLAAGGDTPAAPPTRGAARPDDGDSGDPSSFAADDEHRGSRHADDRSGGTDNDDVTSRPRKRAAHETDDALSLAGILNVLDGALDSPGRIVVMTTNHPEALDPALVRPGRVNMSIAMRNLGPEQAREMLERYFGDGSCPPDSPALAAFEGGGVSPAALEALCGQHESVDSVAREIVLEKNKA